MKTSMIISRRVPLRPNKTMTAKLVRASDVARFYYNLCIEVIKNNQEGVYDDFLRSKGRHKMYYNKHVDRECFSLKRDDIVLIIDNHYKDREFLKEVTYSMKRFITEDALKAMYTGRPKFKSKRKSKPSFPVRCEMSSNGLRDSRIYVKNNKVVIPNIGHVYIAKKYRDELLDCKKQTARIIFDGKHWFLVYTFVILTQDVVKDNNSVGLDVGIINTLVTSENDVYANISNSPKIDTLTKRLKKYSRCVSRKYEANKQDGRFVKTNKIIRLEHKIKMIYRKISNMRRNSRRQIVPSFFTKYVEKHGYYPHTLVAEDLNIEGMMKNKHLAKTLAGQGLYELLWYFEYHCTYYRINYIKAPRFYPSSKLCSSCGEKKTDLKLKDRVYQCSSCGLIIDRDYNASLNLAKLGTY